MKLSSGSWVELVFDILVISKYDYIPTMKYLIDLTYLLLAIAISPFAIYRRIKQGRYKDGWANRFGRISRRDPAKKCIWIHAVSVGEVNSTKTVIDKITSELAGFEIVVSTTTDTGFARAKELFGGKMEVFYFPLDISWTMEKAFRNIRPAVCLLVELEVWPNFTSIARRLSVPVIVINGRISERGFSRYKLIAPFAKKTFNKLALVLAQTDEYAARFKAIGCPPEKVVVTGSLKYDTAQVTDRIEGEDEIAVKLGLGKGPLWVAGGTGPDEEKIIIETYLRLKQQFRDLRLAVVPRKPERFDEVARVIADSGLSFIRYSEIKAAAKSQISNLKPVVSTVEPSQIDSVILVDTMGDLRKFYSLADIIFVGRSLVPMGGSDMMEAAALGKCTIFGPHAFNFKQTVDDLLKGNGAIMVKDGQDMFETMQKCLLQPEFAKTTAANGQEIIRQNQGATAKTVEAIVKLICSPVSRSAG